MCAYRRAPGHESGAGRDVRQDALDGARDAMQAAGAQVLACRIDVSKADAVDALGRSVAERSGAPHLMFNNAGVGAGGLIWETSVKDWEWVLGVNLI
jgi:NAD(P)-dependent dehydrogenase (short-subunit alcohol dehydrogenase family)